MRMLCRRSYLINGVLHEQETVLDGVAEILSKRELLICRGYGREERGQSKTRKREREVQVIRFSCDSYLSAQKCSIAVSSVSPPTQHQLQRNLYYIHTAYTACSKDLLRKRERERVSDHLLGCWDLG